MMKKYWHIVSNLGVTDLMSISEQKKVILLNQLSVIFFFVFSVLNISIHLFYVPLPWFSLLSAFPILIAPIFNYFKKTRISAIMISILTPIVTLFMATDAKLAVIDNVPIFGYIFPRIMLISFIVLPFVFIDKKQKSALIFATIFNFLFVFLFDPYHKLIGVDFFQVNLLLESYYMTNYFIIFPMLTILLALIFLTNINSKYENKVLQLVKELEDMNNKLQNSNATKDKFFSIISHDLKNPFVTLLLMSEKVSNNFDKMEKDKVKNAINSILDSSKSTYKLLDNLLQWARSQTGAMSFEPEELDLYELVFNNFYTLKSQAISKNID